jgi:cell division protein FtsZ
MGTAVRSGSNRAIEAAQAAMASPLLEAGAIDGARGILINITGSSSLKLSEVNEASTLIQSAAHEDANIIFGAVLDEKMGEEVKITVIATGFRDQMPERRARMLSVEEASVVSVPLVSVPVVAPDNWMEEPAASAAAPRFMSEDEDERETAEESGEPVFFSASAAEPVAFPLEEPDAAAAVELDAVESEPLPSRPQFDELAEETVFIPLPRDYASDFAGGLRGEETHEEPQPTQSLFPENGQEAERDLDVPAFMRRLQF